jgi:alginate O-acetyltransferase complex protein AlgJ
MTQFASIRKFATPALHAWALDFPQADAAVRISERGLYLQGWMLGGEGALCAGLVVRTRSEEGDRFQDFPFNTGRPDVIQRVLGAVPAGHSQLRCGFMVYLKEVPQAFTLGVRQGDETVWLCDVQLTGEAPVVHTENKQAEMQVIRGTDGWLFLDNDTNRSVDQYTGRLLLEVEGLERWQAYLDGCVLLAAGVAARHAILIAASKEQVLSEHYPHAKGSPTVHEQVLGLSRPEHRVLDTVSLLRARADKRQCFIKTDTHWTDCGAMHAALGLITLLGLDPNVARRCWSDDSYYTTPFTGDLGVKLVPPVSELTEFLQAPLAVKEAMFDNHLPNIGRVLIFDCESAPWASSLLLFGASSSYPMLKYLKRLFNRIVFVHSAGNVDQAIVQHEEPDYLVMQTTARFMITPPETGFDLAKAVTYKMHSVAENTRARALAAAAVARAEVRNLPYCRMVESNEN